MHRTNWAAVSNILNQLKLPILCQRVSDANRFFSASLNKLSKETNGTKKSFAEKTEKFKTKYECQILSTPDET